MHISYLEQAIARLRDGEFGPGDPRTASLFSTSGAALSFENRRKILEMELGTLKDIERQEALGEKHRREFWSDSLNLAEKLNGTVRFVAAYANIPPEKIADTLAIVQGEGATVIRLEDSLYHYLEIDMPGQPVYIAPKAILPETKIHLLKTVAGLGIKY